MSSRSDEWDGMVARRKNKMNQKTSNKQKKPETQTKKGENPQPFSLPPNLDGWLVIGTIVAPQGLHGEVRVYSDSDFPERFQTPGKRWLLRAGESEPQAVELLQGRYVEGKNLYIIRLAGVENRNQAEQLRGCKLLVPESDRPQLAEDEYHILDLIGLSVITQETQQELGEVVDVVFAGNNELLEVKLHCQPQQAQKTVLIPFVKAIVPVVDLETGRVEITPPEGLLEINN